MEHQVFKRARGVIAREADHKIFRARDQCIFELDAYAFHILSQVLSGQTPEQCYRFFEAHHPHVDPDTIDRDVLAIIQYLITEELIIPKEA